MVRWLTYRKRHSYATKSNQTCVVKTPVMVSVAKSFDAPIKLLFPTADDARPFSMLGLGDIVIPGIGWKSWKKRWFILTRTSLVFFKSDPSTLPQRSGEVNLTLGGIDLKLPQRSGEVNLTFWEAESSKDLFKWKTSLEEALAQAPNAALMMGHNGIFRNDTTDVYEEAIPNCWFPYSLHYHHGERRDLPNPMSLRFTKFENTLMAHLSTFLPALMDAKVVNKVQTKKAHAPKIAKQESSDDDTSDETSESDEEPAKKPAAKPLVAVVKNGSKMVKQESSSDEDNSEDESNDDSDDDSQAWMEWVMKKQKAFDQRGDMTVAAWVEQ
ncbi:Rho GTPase-activating protein 7 [Zea mays]|uniref:Rho GTPase-activating protein 7 n=1 Tax=Zea mays TaxID=4577 RepID=A0A3L6GDG7_MAIZE|nr:Rho GTPase-activating protein 7 [Zea mays]